MLSVGDGALRVTVILLNLNHRTIIRTIQLKLEFEFQLVKFTSLLSVS